MFRKNVFNFVVFLVIAAISNSERVTIDEDLRKFLGALERYANTPNDVVFLLDESGSIGIERFPHVKEFAKLTVQRFSVSEDRSRIAVVTFATDPLTHIDYIKDPKDHNMCTLLKKIDDIGYLAQWTHTDKAMQKANVILENSRPGVHKIIVLLSDGDSNVGHSPVAISSELKAKGIIIFAVGVADVNTVEINAVASSPDHVYILKNFDYIKQVNKYLVNDTTEVWMDLVSTKSLCNSFCDSGADCCDVNANCYCGTRSGRYECACNAGYYGNGHKGECHKCRRGTYKTTARNSVCTACPEHSTTEKEGSKSFSDCFCETGYEKNGNFCIAIKCALLSAPAGGILIPSHCDNTYGSHCSFKCRTGYCAFSCNANNNVPHLAGHNVPLPTRTCLDTRKWSGEEFYCEKVTCPALQYPSYGKHNCSDFTYGTTCHFSCNKGYELGGSESRSCLINGSWTGQETLCEITKCGPLKTNKHLQVKPKDCSTKNKPFRSVCQFYCIKGYSMISNSNDSAGVMMCGPDKKWSGGKISCQDIEPPEIFCPASNQISAEPHKGYAEVFWKIPDAKDNSALKIVRIIQPQGIKPPHDFPIGLNKLIYRAEDYSNLSSDCSFTVNVTDNEPPLVVYCPSDIEVFHDKNSAIPVEWEEPVFEDNSKMNLTITKSQQSEFAWGPETRVYYNATDKGGNSASCSFTVKVKSYACPYYAPPANGMLTCDKWQDGRLCSIFCHEGFYFASRKNTIMYFCKQTSQGGNIQGIWQPLHGRELKMPWPDCSKKQKPSALNVTVGVSFSVDSCSEAVLQKMKEKFIEDVKKLPGRLFCPSVDHCTPENVKIYCSQPTRIKRSISYDTYQRSTVNHISNKRLNRETPKQVLTISFSLEIFPNVTDLSTDSNNLNEFDTGSEINLSSIPLINDIKNKISENVKDVYHLTSVPEPTVNYDVIVICSVGQMMVNNTCVNCPVGTYKEDVSETCIECPQASYQDEERSLSCKPCPIGYTTYEEKSNSKGACKAPCQSGTYSKTTFEPCLACPLNTYQERAGRKDCLKCSPGLFTWRVGSNSSSDCVAPCKPGSFSDTGYEPCNLCGSHSYQDKENQKSCILCPNQMSASVRGSKSIEDCKEIDICKDRHPCHSGSTCIQLDKDYQCVCPEGLTGEHCEINYDDCDSDPCFNNGTCVDGIDKFSCSCLEGWTGHQCETNIDDCISNPCQNGGECLDMLNSYACVCKPGFHGAKCEVNANECVANPCMNNGTCFDKENDYRCCCAKGYYGQNCEKEYDFCDTVTCENGGSCFSSSDDFDCTCPSGFEGKFCENNIDDCDNYLCQNGGICVDGVGNATCSCPQKYHGHHCEEALIPEFMVSFPSPSTSNYVELKNIRMLYAISVSFFMRTSFVDPNSRATPLSYSYQNKGGVVDNALTLLDTNNFILYIHGEMFHTEYAANSDSAWHHYVVTWEKMEGKWSFYVDGKSVAEGLHVGEEKVMYPGIFILGQEQDSLGGSFSSLEAFAGDITEFNVWDYALSVEEIRQISTSCGFVGNVIPWYVASKLAHGNVVISSQVDKCSGVEHCSGNSCGCYYSNQESEYSCKHEMQACSEKICANGQNCVTDEHHSFCNCSSAFEGRRCEYDIDECLENNGGCEYFCINDVGSYHCDCPEDMMLSENSKSCKETSFCLIDGDVYPDGESWVNSCRDCICDHGRVRCEEKVCNQTDCHPEETMIIAPGECCAKCVAWSFCFISPNNTIMTFDMSSYQIEGECIYTAIEDCIGGHFKVQIEPAQNSTDKINLAVYQDCLKVVLSFDGKVYIDDNVIELPFENEEILVEDGEDNSSIAIWTHSNLHLEWNFTDEVLIAVPITDVNKVCGLCKKIEDYSTHKIGKYPLPDRTASVRKLSSDFYTFILSNF